MKFLVSLINNSRQPARRSGIPVSARQAGPIGPPLPPQEGLALRADEQPLQPAPHAVSNNLSEMASERQHIRPTLITEESAPLPAAGTRMGASEHPMSDDLTPRPVARDESDTTPANAEQSQPSRADAATGAEERPLPAVEPAVSVGQSGGTAAEFATRDTLSAAPSLTQPAVAQIPTLQSSVDSFTPGAEQKQAAAPTRMETESDDSTQADQQLGNEPAREPSATRPPSQEQAAIPVRRLQAAVQQEQSAPGSSALRQSAKQNQPREIPQVRIGQINVLVEDQAPVKPKQNKRSAGPATPNPFGLRGL